MVRKKQDKTKAGETQGVEVPRLDESQGSGVGAGMPDARDRKIAELTELLQRLQAEFENYRKRVEQDFEKCRQYSCQQLIVKLLPVLDSLEMALKSASTEHQEFVKGMKLIYSQLMAVLESEGLRPIECLNKPFDAYRHEVLMQVPSDKARDGMVLEELQKGYMLKDRVLRHSKVKVGRQAKKEKDNADKQEHQEKRDGPTGP
jgi:molecular chaperone GrpE